MHDDFKIAVKITIDAAALLEGLIEEEIEKTVALKRTRPERQEHLAQCLGKLRDCLTAVRLAQVEAASRGQKPKR